MAYEPAFVTSRFPPNINFKEDFMNDGFGKENQREGRLDNLAKSIFEFRDICTKARSIVLDKAAKLFGSTEDSECGKPLSGEGLVGELSMSIASAKSDILKVMEFVDSL